MSTAKLKTGDVKKYSRNRFYNDSKASYDNVESAWAVICNGPDCDGHDILGYDTRSEARACKWNPGERIARILKITSKTVTVEISK